MREMVLQRCCQQHVCWGGMKAEENADFSAGGAQPHKEDLKGQDQDRSLGCPSHLLAGPSKLGDAAHCRDVLESFGREKKKCSSLGFYLFPTHPLQLQKLLLPAVLDAAMENPNGKGQCCERELGAFSFLASMRVMGKLYLGFSFSLREGIVLSLPKSLGYCHWEVPGSKTSKNTWVLLCTLQSPTPVRCWGLQGERCTLCKNRGGCMANVSV